jgi:cytochrome P450 / NADPH-cytochrome P450 reductase
MLSFVTYNLAKNPDALAKLRAEIDEVLGDQPIQLSDLGKMPYTVGKLHSIDISTFQPSLPLAIMRETLRLNPTVPIRTVSAVQPTTVCNGKYGIEPDEIVALNTYSMQRDPAVWGSDVGSHAMSI